ncbi:MAG TPA: pseudouridine synthase [Candidatus Polarisedimenticolia bacterium]|nr:pseudouridine synthase [Candidatus Polarisedimenticolia bacterium]
MGRGASKHEPEEGNASGLERIHKVLARAGIASRREAESWLAHGRISVNGSVVTQPGFKVDPGRDHIKVDGRRVRPAGARAYYLLNKPDGFVTTTRDPQGRPTVMDLLRGVKERVYPVGRLDFHTTGLLIMTNDGDLAERLTRPGGGCRKVYQVKVKGLPAGETLRRLAGGIVLDGRRTLPCRIRVLSSEGNAWLEVSLEEGRNNQIRRMFQRAGHPVSRLRRVAIGPVADRRLRPGGFRRLTGEEVRRLREAVP